MNGVLIDFKAPVAPDPSPNATQPLDTRISTLPQSSAGNATLWLGAIGGTPTLELWFSPFGDDPPTWVKLTTAAPLTPADHAAVLLPLGGVPAGCALFVRVTAVGGATRIFAGLTRA